MCLILLAWQVDSRFPLVVAANRDEFFARRSAAADYWLDHPHVLAGRDLVGGGTWLGLTRHGRFAALTNFRNPAAMRAEAPSRGRLVAEFLTGDASLDAYLDALPASDYNGFNLVLGEPGRLCVFSNVTGERHALAPGVYGLSNALLDSPWPKVGAGKTALKAALTALPDEAGLFRLLRDQTVYPDDRLPATGVSLAWERILSASFVRSLAYGTRCSTVLKVGSDATASLDEQTWLPGGVAGERHRYRLTLDNSRRAFQTSCRDA